MFMHNRGAEVRYLLQKMENVGIEGVSFVF